MLTGNQTGAVLIDYLLRELQKRNQLPKKGVVFNHHRHLRSRRQNRPFLWLRRRIDADRLQIHRRTSPPS
ncbi:MAG: hypothetical protein MZU97_19465 [Bacillus subtilis]|nr:hypothetical protein [Bacillus subtilis]